MEVAAMGLRERTIYVLVLGALLRMVSVAHAQILWRPLSYPELIADSDLVVIGKVVEVSHGTHKDGAVDCAKLQVAEVLWGTAQTGSVRLDYPARKPQHAETTGGPVPTDIFYEDGQEGIWFLQKEADGHYAAPHPARFRPMMLLLDVRQAIAKQLTTPPNSGT